jgi:hypothetical protein
VTDTERPGVGDTGPRGNFEKRDASRYTAATADTSPPNKRGGATSRRKGGRIERETVEAHRALGVHAERYPLSGSSRFRGSGHDVDVYVFGRDEGPLVAEVKARKDGSGFVQLERWLGDYDILVLRRNHAEPLILLPWRVWACLLERVRR